MEELKINLDDANVFTLLIFPINVSLLHFQMFNIFSMLRNLSSKVNLSVLSVLYEKKTPSALVLVLFSFFFFFLNVFSHFFPVSFFYYLYILSYIVHNYLLLVLFYFRLLF